MLESTSAVLNSLNVGVFKKTTSAQYFVLSVSSRSWPSKKMEHTHWYATPGLAAVLKCVLN